ncbi:hypothetical protein HMPREF1576_00812 [Gardnerella pickettii JCP7719]|uniref:Uncharacterized protein n=1 Tax=Gardnerella pickettii JCP7719 TaxID=1261061 RepID=S4I7Q2_9BIFI|nr:hypothetical protein HMPREF1576_00812 [Gardnerella pickettii JCP7719]
MRTQNCHYYQAIIEYKQQSNIINNRTQSTIEYKQQSNISNNRTYSTIAYIH